MDKLIFSKVVVIPLGIRHGEPDDQAAHQAEDDVEIAFHRAEIPFAKKRKIRKTNNSHFWIVLHHFLDQRSIPANGFVSISFSDFTILAVFGAHGVVIADVWQAYVGAELAQVGVLFVVMFTAAVVMAGGVAINHGPGEIARNDFVDRHSGRSTMQGDAQLVEQLDGTATNAATDDIGATLGSEETRHGAMLMLRGLFDNGLRDSLIVKNALVGQAVSIGLHVLVFGEQFARNRVAFAFHDARVEVVIAELQMREASGFEMPPPVVICAIPGCLAMASMRLVEGSWRSSFAFRMVMGIGDSFIFMSPKAPVTITSFSSMCLKNISVESGRLCAVIGNAASISNGR